MIDHTAFNQWMRAIAHGVGHLTVDGGMYEGEEGAKRLARECGAALPNFGDAAEISATYSGICVIAYMLKPPIDAKTWRKEMEKGREKALAVERVPMPEDYQPAQIETVDEITAYKRKWGCE